MFSSDAGRIILSPRQIKSDFLKTLFRPGMIYNLDITRIYHSGNVFDAMNNTLLMNCYIYIPKLS